MLRNVSSTNIGDRIRRVRLEKDISQVDLATAAGVKPHTMWRYEKGQIRQPSPEILAKVADRLGVSVRWLTTGQGDSSAHSRVEHEDRAAWLELVDEGYVDYARKEGVLEEEVQSIRHYSDGRNGLTAEDFREMLDRAIARARRSLHFKASPADRELPESREARERRQREGGRVTRLRGPEETPE